MANEDVFEVEFTEVENDLSECECCHQTIYGKQFAIVFTMSGEAFSDSIKAHGKTNRMNLCESCYAATVKDDIENIE